MSVTASSLSADAVAAVVGAAAVDGFVVVDHAVPADVIPGPAELEQLAAELPKNWVRGVDSASGEVGAYGRELGPVLPHQVDRPTVTRLYHVQRSPRFRTLTDSVYDELERAWDPGEPWTGRDAGFFVSSSGGLTPAHADRHHNLLVQIKGSKQIGISVPGTRAHAQVVARSVPHLRAAEMPEGAVTIDLFPGQAVYMPPYTLHWVRSTEESVALSCGWSSQHTARAGQVHAANASLLRWGIPPGPVPGRLDGAKLGIVAGARRVKQRVRGAAS